MFDQDALEEFFRSGVSAFNRGQSTGLAQYYSYPLTIELGYGSIYIEDEHAFSTTYQTYRENLDREGFARAEFEFDHHEAAPDGTVRTLITFRYINRAGAMFREVPACYFTKPAPDGGWRVVGLDLVAAPNARLTSGLPLH